MDAFIGEIRIFPYTFAPSGWAFCNGQILSISQNTALYSIVTPIYGGNGTTDFALPNLQGRVPMHPGQASGQPSSHSLAETGGSETITLTLDQMAPHNHPLLAQNFEGDLSQPVTDDLARSVNFNAYAPAGSPVAMAQQAVPSVGNGQPHNNMQPYLTCNFCIALTGDYPQRP